MAPDWKASDRPRASPSEEACAVRTLARTEISIPMNPAAPESRAPIANPTAAKGPIRTAARIKTTTPTMAMAVY